MKQPALVKVQSSNIEAMGHDSRGLFVRFSGGALYSYPAVPKDLYDEGLKAESPGKWFRDKVRGQFAHVKHDG